MPGTLTQEQIDKYRQSFQPAVTPQPSALAPVFLGAAEDVMFNPSHNDQNIENIRTMGMHTVLLEGEAVDFGKDADPALRTIATLKRNNPFPPVLLAIPSETLPEVQSRLTDQGMGTKFNVVSFYEIEGRFIGLAFDGSFPMAPDIATFLEQESPRQG